LGKQIVIAGSYNASFFIKGKKIPNIGETMVGDVFFVSPGGKGSNQAIAAKYQNADVRFICKLGNDSFANDAVKMYKKVGLYSESITIDESIHTGIAVIFIDQNGNNSIMVVPGANLHLSADEIVREVTKVNGIFIAGFQLENNVDEIVKAMGMLHKRGIKVLLDPAPAHQLPEEIYRAIAILKPNEHEAEILSGIKVSTPADAFRAAELLHAKGAETVIITLGAGGAVVVDGRIKEFIPAPKVNAIDTTGAGDIFSGSLLTALSKDMQLLDAVRYANAAASLSVTKMGVFEATPTEEETLAFIANGYRI
jgi:ribokinase